MPSDFHGVKPHLKYLFTATFEDGKVIQQSPEDFSQIDPPVRDENGILQGRSAFHDVLTYEEISPLVTFELQEQGIFGLVANKFSVDLRTGLFTVNGLQFNAAEQLFIPTAPFQIVFCRETHRQQDISQKDGRVVAERIYVNRYLIGWKTTWKNEKYQVTIAVDGR